MKFSRRWLLDFIPPERMPDDESLSALLTGRGIEIESMETLSSHGLVAGKVCTVRAHSNADKLRVCEVDTGEKTNIVCGAPNVAEGQHVVVAPPGAVVGGGVMKSREIRGELSAGMICSAAEIGAGGDSEGIMVLPEIKPGTPLDDKLYLPDTVFDAGITPNRGDCLSHLGIAREVSAAAGVCLSLPEISYSAEIDDIFPVTIEETAKAACPYYACVVIRGVDADRPAPWWVRSLLSRCGLRPISAAVDITNYVMLSLGQPLHAFDMDKLHEGICVRMAKDEEEIELLNGETIRCRADTIMIADKKKSAAMGGVMGGMESSVSAKTTNILLEGAFFSPTSVRGKTTRHNITSDAAFRFERGVDAKLPPRALSLAAKMIIETCGGKSGPVHAAGEPPVEASPVNTSGEYIRALIGAEDLTSENTAEMLSAMGIRTETKGDNIIAHPPTWRFDLERPADLAEEAVRAWGYDKLPETSPPGGINISPMPPRPFSSSRARHRLSAMGFAEVITYAFVPPHWESILNPKQSTVELQNPINRDMSVMRTTLLGGLIDRALFNINHRVEDLRLFEIGRCFFAGGEENSDWQKHQPLHAAGIVVGGASPVQWGTQSREADFFDVKGCLEEFLSPAGEVLFDGDSPRSSFLHPQQSSNIIVKGELTGVAGVLHPRISADFGFRRPPLVFEIYLEKLSDIRHIPRALSVSRFPQVRRDLSVLSDTRAETVLSCVREVFDGEAALFDVYEGGNIPLGKKCYGIRLTMQGRDKNLTDDDIRKMLSTVVTALSEAGMTLRQ